MPHATPVMFVVDDDASVRGSLAALLRFAGRQVEVFAAQRRVGRMADTHAFDLAWREA